MQDEHRVPEVALEEMNAVHYEEMDFLIELLNRLDAVASGKLKPLAIDASLESLFAHVRAHFAREEEQMSEAAFPARHDHKVEHDRVLEELRGRIDAWLRERDTQALSAYLGRTLPAWMLEHISAMDAVAARFLVARGQRYRSAD